MVHNTASHPTVLVVDDDTKILFAFEQVLNKEGYECITASSGSEALSMLVDRHPMVVFLDIAMPSIDGMETLGKIKACDPSVRVIMITGHGTMQTAIKAMQMGAFDYLTKPLDIDKVRQLTRRAIASRQDIAVTAGREPGGPPQAPVQYELIGNSPMMQEVYKAIGSIAMTPNGSSVLITGESGTGKEFVARAIHLSGKNAMEPFVPINCTALPENLLESELFGHEKGAFTGAFERKVGKFEIAKGGTIFLDEIGSLPISLQQKLLRAVQEREFERVGGNQKLTVDARFIAATNVHLETAVQHQTFREDLFFRLNVVTLRLPPLRQRMEDLPLLADHFLRKYGERINKHVKGFSAEAMTILMNHSYPGNVRQLENIVERAVIFSKGEVIVPDDLAEDTTHPSGHDMRYPMTSTVFDEARDYVLGAFEAQFVHHLLSKHRGNVTEAARESKMTRQNFQRLMKKHTIRSDHYR